MFLSIVIPIWNDEKYLEECLDSCLDQELSAEEYEVICVDDGSTDRTPQILQDYDSRFSNVHVIFAQHQGGTKGRETGLAAARGAFVWFVDHDDLLAPHAVDTLYSYYREHPGYDRYAFPYYEFSEALSEQELIGFKNRSLRSNASGLGDIVVWTSILSVAFLREKQITVRSGRIAAAKEFWKMEKFPVMGTDAIFVQECKDKDIKTAELTCGPLYYYRRNATSQTLNPSEAAKKSKDRGYYNTALLNAYLAIQYKEQYFQERSACGKASFDVTRKAIMHIRTAVTHLAELPRKEWKAGMRQLKSADVFFRRIPEEYTFRFSDFWKSRSWKGRLSPANVAFYYLFLPGAGGWYYFFNSFKLLGKKSTRLLSWWRGIKNKRLRKAGLSGQNAR